jgi:DNA-binding NarL/FixJ family response regulator
VEMLQATYKVLGAFSDGNSVLSDIFALNPDILLLDISLGDLNGFEVARRLRDRGSSAKIIFLSVHEDVEFVTASFDAGACGYVFKARAAEDLTKAIDTVFRDGRFVSPTPDPACRISNN